MTTKHFFRAIALTTATMSMVHVADGSPEPVRIDQHRLGTFSAEDQVEILCIAERLDEIASMERSALSREERKALRAEARELKAEADVFNHAGNGTVIYISGGTLLIVLLLILILS